MLGPRSAASSGRAWRAS